MGLNNAQRALGYRDEYVYNINTDKWYIRTPGDNYREVTPGPNPVPANAAPAAVEAEDPVES